MRAVRNFLAGFAEIAASIRSRSATDDDCRAFGCAYMFLGIVFLFLLSVAAFACITIWNFI